jgi:hypothetical protein
MNSSIKAFYRGRQGTSNFQLTPIFTIAYDGAYEEAEALEKKGRAGIDFQAQEK